MFLRISAKQLFVVGCVLLWRHGGAWLLSRHHQPRHRCKMKTVRAPCMLLLGAATEPTSALLDFPDTLDVLPTDSVATATAVSAWEVLAGNMAACLIASDMKRDSGFDGSSTGWTSWVEESSAFRLQKCIDKLVFSDMTSEAITKRADDSSLDETIRWLRWMKSSPATMIVELSEDLRASLGKVMTSKDYERVDQSPEDFLGRIACRILLLPSGATLKTNLQSPPGAMVYGKLLYGGVTRFRILGNTADSRRPKRKAGERTVIAPPRTGNELVPTEAWVRIIGHFGMETPG
jgi:hypothetical protein